MHAKMAADKALPVAERKKSRGRVGKKGKSEDASRASPESSTSSIDLETAAVLTSMR